MNNEIFGLAQDKIAHTGSPVTYTPTTTTVEQSMDNSYEGIITNSADLNPKEINQTPALNASDEKELEKRKKFRESSKVKVRRVTGALASLGKCSGSAYSFTQEEIDYLFAYLQNSLNETKTLFDAKVEKPSFEW